MPAAPASASPAPRLTPGIALLLLTLLLSFQPLSTDLYLPALPTLADALGSTIAGAQLTLAVLSVAFGVSQLVCGPLADRYGRRPVLLAGLALYTLASIAAAAAPTMAWLVIMRGVQGAAMAACVVCARAVLRDLYQPEAGARVLARALTGLGGVAVLSPVLGGLTVAAAGWRATLGLLALGGAVTLLLVWRRYSETTPKRDREATRVVPMLRNWLTIVRNPVFRRFTLLSMFTYSGVYAYLAGSSFVMVSQWGVSRPVYGVFVGAVAIAYIAGTIYCRRSVRQRGVGRTVGIGSWFSLAGGGSMGLLALAGAQTPWAIVLPHCVYMFGHGIHQPCTQSGAVGPFPHAAGVASALTGFGMVLFAFPLGLFLGYALTDASYPLPATIALCAVATFAMAQRIARA